MAAHSPETQNTNLETIEQSHLTVSQPKKLENILETINLINTVSERIGEDRSGDLGSGGGTQAGAQGDDGATQSARDQAIANLPTAPAMQRELRKYLEKEIKDLRKEVKRTSGHLGKPGSAYKLNELYKRMRRLNSILQQLLTASIDVVRRLYIRVFVDKQTAF